MSWAVLDIGCVHCGHPTLVVGVYETEYEAETAYDRYVEDLEQEPRQRTTDSGSDFFDSDNRFIHSLLLIELRPGASA